MPGLVKIEIDMQKKKLTVRHGFAARDDLELPFSPSKGSGLKARLEFSESGSSISLGFLVLSAT